MVVVTTVGRRPGGAVVTANWAVRPLRVAFVVVCQQPATVVASVLLLLLQSQLLWWQVQALLLGWRLWPWRGLVSVCLWSGGKAVLGGNCRILGAWPS